MFKVMFSCKVCGLVDEEAECRYRRPDEDIIHYLQKVILPAVNLQHQLESFTCPAKNVDLKLPMPEDGSKPIGLPPDAED